MIALDCLYWSSDFQIIKNLKICVLEFFRKGENDYDSKKDV